MITPTWAFATSRSPTLVYHATTIGAAYDLAIAGDYAFIDAGSAGLQALDITNPAQPVTVVTYVTPVTPDCARQVVSANRLIYVADQFGGLYIFTLITAP